ncbi:hypothetical protein GCM10009657_16270 [Oryzihumus leptocrescens]
MVKPVDHLTDDELEGEFDRTKSAWNAFAVEVTARRRLGTPGISRLHPEVTLKARRHREVQQELARRRVSRG